MDRKTITFITATVALSLLYLTLLIGLTIDNSRPYFLPYIPILYLISGITLLYFHKGWSPTFILYILITFLGCFIVQLANVKTNFIYGQMTYGATLGPKILGVPIVATFNRFILLYCVGLLVKRLKIKYAVFSSLLGALILVFFNLLAEPVATSLKIRAWASQMSPLQDYGGRFIAAFVFLYLFNMMDFPKKNKMYLPVFIMEVLFFIYLNIVVI